jgi:hypothetical protein
MTTAELRESQDAHLLRVLDPLSHPTGNTTPSRP